jgi:hypothetical protein
MDFVLEKRIGEPDNELEKPGLNRFRFCVLYGMIAK